MGSMDGEGEGGREREVSGYSCWQLVLLKTKHQPFPGKNKGAIDVISEFVRVSREV